MVAGVAAGSAVAVGEGVTADRGVAVAWAGMVGGIPVTAVCAGTLMGCSGEGVRPGVSVGRGASAGVGAKVGCSGRSCGGPPTVSSPCNLPPRGKISPAEEAVLPDGV